MACFKIQHDEGKVVMVSGAQKENKIRTPEMATESPTADMK